MTFKQFVVCNGCAEERTPSSRDTKKYQEDWRESNTVGDLVDMPDFDKSKLPV